MERDFKQDFKISSLHCFLHYEKTGVTCIQYTIHWNKTQMLEKFRLGQNKRYKKCSLFSFATSNASQFNFQYAIIWARFVSLKLCVGFSIFNSAKCMDSLILNVIISFKIKIIEKPHSFSLRTLIFNLQQEVSKFNDVCVSWSSPKSDLQTNILNLENRSFENVSFSPY